MRNMVVAALCGTLAGVAVQAAPRPVPAPAGARDHVVTLRELSVRVQSLERDAWDWRAFYRCVHTRDIVVQGDVIPVTWRNTPGCLRGRTP